MVSTIWSRDFSKYSSRTCAGRLERGALAVDPLRSGFVMKVIEVCPAPRGNADRSVRATPAGWRVRYSIIFGLFDTRRMTDTPQPVTEAALAAKTTMDINDIQRILPHRYPFLLIDRVIDLTRKRADRRDQECHDQRAVLSGAFSRTCRSCREF